MTTQVMQNVGNSVKVFTLNFPTFIGQMPESTYQPEVTGLLNGVNLGVELFGSTQTITIRSITVIVNRPVVSDMVFTVFIDGIATDKSIVIKAGSTATVQGFGPGEFEFSAPIYLTLRVDNPRSASRTDLRVSFNIMYTATIVL